MSYHKPIFLPKTSEQPFGAIVLLPDDYVEGTKLPCHVHFHGKPAVSYNGSLLDLKRMYSEQAWGADMSPAQSCMQFLDAPTYFNTVLILIQRSNDAKPGSQIDFAIAFARNRPEVDVNNVHGSGFSLGGYDLNNWLNAVKSPPIAFNSLVFWSMGGGGGVPVAVAANAIVAAKIAVWLVHAPGDDVTSWKQSENLYNAILAASASTWTVDGVNTYPVQFTKPLLTNGGKQPANHNTFSNFAQGWGDKLNFPDMFGGQIAWLPMTPGLGEGFNNPGAGVFDWQLMNKNISDGVQIKGVRVKCPVRPWKRPPVEIPGGDTRKIKSIITTTVTTTVYDNFDTITKEFTTENKF